MNKRIRLIQKEETWTIRQQVMWPNKELDFVKLENDDKGVHYGLFEDDSLISIISLFIDGQEAQFRKFATVTAKQGQGYGTELLSEIIKNAAHLGVNKIWCNARKDKVDFYKRFYLKETEVTFERNGVFYQIMEKELK